MHLLAAFFFYHSSYFTFRLSALSLLRTLARSFVVACPTLSCLVLPRPDRPEPRVPRVREVMGEVMMGEVEVLTAERGAVPLHACLRLGSVGCGLTG
jgi:hypothetical protein